MAELGLLDQLPHVTSRIEARDAAGNTSVGTGFFFNFPVAGKGDRVVLITNKHVVEGAVEATIYITRAKPDGSPMFGEYNQWKITGFDQTVVGHPDPNVDLAAFPVGAVFQEMASQGRAPFFRCFSESDLPSDNLISSFSAIEDVLMIGYPTGIWDRTNNMPVIRRGITATPYSIDYNGQPEFMIDAACFPGSSGSPILIANEGSYTTRQGMNLGNRLHLLGLLWGGPQYTAEGRIEVKPVPTKSVPIAKSPIPTNLGYCIKSRMIRDLRAVISARFGD